VYKTKEDPRDRKSHTWAEDRDLSDILREVAYFVCLRVQETINCESTVHKSASFRMIIKKTTCHSVLFNSLVSMVSSRKCIFSVCQVSYAFLQW